MTNPPDMCGNCRGDGYVEDVRVASITHRATTVRRRCRPCRGTGETQPPPPPLEPEIGEIPEWMLG